MISYDNKCVFPNKRNMGIMIMLHLSSQIITFRWRKYPANGSTSSVDILRPKFIPGCLIDLVYHQSIPSHSYNDGSSFALSAIAFYLIFPLLLLFSPEQRTPNYSFNFRLCVPPTKLLQPFLPSKKEEKEGKEMILENSPS